MENQKKTRKMLMAMVGVYLVYTGFNLVKDVLNKEPENMMFFLIAGVVFLAIGAVTTIVNIKAYYQEVKAEVEAASPETGEDADESEAAELIETEADEEVLEAEKEEIEE